MTNFSFLHNFLLFLFPFYPLTKKKRPVPAARTEQTHTKTKHTSIVMYFCFRANVWSVRSTGSVHWYSRSKSRHARQYESQGRSSGSGVITQTQVFPHKYAVTCSQVQAQPLRRRSRTGFAPVSLFSRPAQQAPGTFGCFIVSEYHKKRRPASGTAFGFIRLISPEFVWQDRHSLLHLCRRNPLRFLLHSWE